MTFAYSQIELYVDSEDKVLTLIIEHPDFFYTVLNDINDQIEGETGFSVISCNAKLISFAKQATMITEFVPFEMNRKELISKLYAHLKNALLTKTCLSEQTKCCLRQRGTFLSWHSMQKVNLLRMRYAMLRLC